MKTINLEDRPDLDAFVRECEQERTVLLRGGRAVAMVSRLDEDDMDWLAIETSPEFIESIARARQQAKEGKTITHEELKKKLGLD